MIKLAILLSGTGSNARNLCSYFAGHPNIEVVLLLTNKADSGAPDISREYGIPYRVFTRDDLYGTDKVICQLLDFHIDVIVLAGFLWLLPKSLLEKYPGRIINIHPALLPQYGGKGMYGMRVHEAVKANRETESGITIHLCNEQYDEGDVLFQAKCPLTEADTPLTIAQKVYALEYEFFPKVVEEYAGNLGSG